MNRFQTMAATNITRKQITVYCNRCSEKSQKNVYHTLENDGNLDARVEVFPSVCENVKVNYKVYIDDFTVKIK